MTVAAHQNVAFTLNSDNGIPRVAIYNRLTGALALYRNGLLAIRDTLYDIDYYAATRRYIGVPIEQASERVARWGKVVSQRGIDMGSLSPIQYSALMRGEDIPAEPSAPEAPAIAVIAGSEPAEVTWKPGVPRSTRTAKVRYYESRRCGQMTYRIGGSAGRWFVVRFLWGSGTIRRTPFTGSHAVALLEQITGTP